MLTQPGVKPLEETYPSGHGLWSPGESGKLHAENIFIELQYLFN